MSSITGTNQPAGGGKVPSLASLEVTSSWHACRDCNSSSTRVAPRYVTRWLRSRIHRPRCNPAFTAVLPEPLGRLRDGNCSSCSVLDVVKRAPLRCLSAVELARSGIASRVSPRSNGIVKNLLSFRGAEAFAWHRTNFCFTSYVKVNPVTALTGVRFAYLFCYIYGSSFRKLRMLDSFASFYFKPRCRSMTKTCPCIEQRGSSSVYPCSTSVQFHIMEFSYGEIAENTEVKNAIMGVWER